MLVPTASERLGEPGIADEVEWELTNAGLSVTRIDVGDRAALQSADVIAVSGGDPFHLLHAARAAGFADAVRASGAVYVGYSAGAMVAGPTLEPITLTSPFMPPPGLALAGLGLTDVLVLPHHGRPGRAARHAEAIARFGTRVRLEPLHDGDYVIVDGDDVRVLRG